MSIEHDCSGHMLEFLKELPKCEHHVHIEGTLEPDLLFSLAKRNNIQLPETFPSTIAELSERYNNFADLQDFLDHYYIGMSVLLTEDDFFELAWAYFQKAHKDGLHHTETFFDPQGHVERGIPFDVVINGLKRASDKAEAELGISTKLIMCLLRHLPPKDCLDTIHTAKPHFENGWIHGLGLDSSEVPFPPELFTECYEHVRNNFPSVGLTAHAGEEGGPERITNSIDSLKVTRIDHGINSRKDPKVLQHLADNKTLLSVCPLSNLKLQAVKDIAELPIKVLLEYGVPFSINSDDPAYFGGYILDNYIVIQKKFGLDINSWRLIAENSVNGSWIEDERKNEILKSIELVYNKYHPLLA